MKSQWIRRLSVLNVLTVLLVTNIAQAAAGTIRVDLESENAQADAQFDGTLEVQPVRFAPKTIKSFGLKDSKLVSLTIDDGPTAGVTSALLDVLKENGVKATFFMVGENAARNLNIVKRVADEGHLIANHSYTHNMFLSRDKARNDWKCDPDNEMYDELKRTHDVLAPFIPKHQKRLYFRPAGGGWCARYTTIMNADPIFRNYSGPLYWSMGGSVEFADRGDRSGPLSDAGDEDCWTNYEFSVDRCLQGYKAAILRLGGGVILTHDVHMKSVELLRKLIPQLKAKGFKFITLDEVKSLNELQPLNRGRGI